MQNVKNESVDLILADLPYGVTNNEWDEVIPYEKLWVQYKRIIKEHGCIALFGQEPFSSNLRMSNRRMYRYDWIWRTPEVSNFLNAHKMPLRAHQNISVFYKRLPKYKPQMRTGFKPYKSRGTGKLSVNYALDSKSVSKYKGTTSSGNRYPIDVLEFSRNDGTRLHPTQKPIKLLEYLIQTYTDEGDLVLDNVMGSGSTGVAAINTNRDFIGMEKEPKYFEMAKKRIERQDYL